MESPQRRVDSNEAVSYQTCRRDGVLKVGKVAAPKPKRRG